MIMNRLDSVPWTVEDKDILRKWSSRKGFDVWANIEADRRDADLMLKAQERLYRCYLESSLEGCCGVHIRSYRKATRNANWP